VEEHLGRVHGPNNSQKFKCPTIVKETEEMTKAVVKGYEGMVDGLGMESQRV